MIDTRAMLIADRVCEGAVLAEEDIRYLLQFDPYGPEAAYVKVRARQLAQKASGGRGFIYAQIGVDAYPCPENCVFCSFAAQNDGLGQDETGEVSLEDIVAAARLFDELGVHLISLMSTAALPFPRFLEMVEAVRGAVADDMVLMVNTRDLSAEEARACKEAGADAAYHAVRLQEGTITDIQPETRLETIRNIHDADLSLMSGVEPVWSEVDKDELAAAIYAVPGYQPFATGACGLTSVEGIETNGMTPPSQGYVAYVGALCRLACGADVPVGGCGGTKWVDAGCDPRSRGFAEEEERIRKSFQWAKHALISDEWIVPDRPVRDIL